MNFNRIVRLISFVLVALIFIFLLRSCFSKDGVMRSSRLIVARSINWSSYNQLSGVEYQMQAFVEDLLLQVAKDEKMKVTLVPSDPRTSVENLQEEKYDAIFTLMVPDSINQSYFLFSDLIYPLGSVLVVRNEHESVKNIKDMSGKLVGVQKDSQTARMLSRYPDIILLTYDNIHSALSDVAYDKIDGVILDAWSAKALSQGIYAGKIRVATQPFTDQGIRLMMLYEEKNEEIINKFNTGLKKLKDSGEYNKLIDKWDLYEP